MAIRVHLADDHTMFREGLESILASREGTEVVGSTPTGPEAVDRVGQTKPDVIVTQLDMQPKGAEEIISGLHGPPRIQDRDAHPVGQAALRAGRLQDGHRRLPAQDLLGRGNAVISMPRRLLQRLGDEPVGSLSERQTEVMVLAARGLPNARIAQELHVAEATIKRHLANIYQKLGVRSRNEVVRKALEEQWIGPPRPIGRRLRRSGRLGPRRDLFTRARGRVIPRRSRQG